MATTVTHLISTMSLSYSVTPKTHP